LPGAALAALITSGSDLNFELTSAMNRNGELATSAMGVKSRTGSMVKFFWMAGAITKLSACPMTMS